MGIEGFKNYRLDFTCKYAVWTYVNIDVEAQVSEVIPCSDMNKLRWKINKKQWKRCKDGNIFVIVDQFERMIRLRYIKVSSIIIYIHFTLHYQLLIKNKAPIYYYHLPHLIILL